MTVPSAKGYIFTERLGSGTYATVYKAYRKSAAREVVAIKCVQKSKLNRTSTENLLTEIELLKTLRHEHIVELKDFQWDANYIYLVMEYCSGGDLGHFIQARHTLSEHTARRFLQQLAFGLRYMREMNVSHLDLKPQNILLSSMHNPVLKIGDFGFAHYLIGETEAAILRGSPLYMAPEIITKRQYDEKADLWSVGVILYECLFGQAPFASKSLGELEKKIKDSKPIQLPPGVQVSDSCRKLLHGLLQRVPDRRMSFEEFFASPFIDLEHQPQATSLPTAVKLVTAAVKFDTEHKYDLAVEHYSRALQHFIPSIHCESNTSFPAFTVSQVKQYMRRAEELKALLKTAATDSQSATSARSTELGGELVTLFLSVMHMLA
ncbi:hypothetical protein NP493_197g05000 [Ridgeia piscesae]|uniref:Serine/threonine-protein kinase ULK3 n=1 Tax=Ridgeia piscesae TaxID=27915 RepID=A0AAD9P220_RIDPI|nr:hypothetical protein NP493_197g05000 [Ridgeia piscesae]